MENKKTLFTVGDISRRYGIPRDRVAYTIQKNEVAESERAGILRLFTPEQVRQIAKLARQVRGANGDGTTPV
jgi:hypothetical protein